MSSSQQLTRNNGPAPAPVAPTMDNSAEALAAAKKQQLQARGAAATLFTQQRLSPQDGGTLMSGSSQTKKMMLGT